MKTVGIFEAKTKLSELCEQVAESREPVVVTRRGAPLVRIDPIDRAPATIRERRAEYVVRYGKAERRDGDDFEPAARSEEISGFTMEG